MFENATIACCTTATTTLDPNINVPEHGPGSASGPGPESRPGPSVAPAPPRGAAALSGPGPDLDPGPGPGSEHCYHYFFSKVRVLVLNQPIRHDVVHL